MANKKRPGEFKPAPVTRHTPRKLGVRAIRAAEKLIPDLDGVAPDDVVTLELANVLKKYGPGIHAVFQDRLETDPGSAEPVIREISKLHRLDTTPMAASTKTQPEIEPGIAALDVFK